MFLFLQSNADQADGVEHLQTEPAGRDACRQRGPGTDHFTVSTVQFEEFQMAGLGRRRRLRPDVRGISFTH